PIQRATDLSALKARTDQERRFAVAFDREGPRIAPDSPTRTVDPTKYPNGQFLMDGIQALDSGSLPVAQRLAGFACRSDTLVGTLHSRRALLSKSESVLFTLVTVDVDRWIVPVFGPSRVVVAFRGAKVRVGAETYSWPGREAPADGRYVFKTGRISQSSRTELEEVADVVPIVDGRLTINGISGTADDILSEMAQGVRVCTGDAGT
ncbi:MAG TPA: hypothetical protein VG871_08820, partial [Vicinamibacterales bacterium]|nr:hypothetical protein [Vicinamibacterales bacterium]